MRSLYHQLVLFVGGYIVCFTCQAETPINDNCEDAIELQPASPNLELVTEGSTTEATSDGLNLCGENLVLSPGVWYLYPSAEEKAVVQVSTCGNQTDFDTALTVYSGSCPQLQCVNGKDDDFECGVVDSHSTIGWHAEANTRYYILVHGSEANHTGNFELTITTDTPATPPRNDGDGDGASTATNPCVSLISMFLAIAAGSILTL
mmetsp:Transcript_36556/g.77108  ORF Transcript_36556/g.77108 Transcript_36556/m.77108 type:complete len:205 (+) Transcript_36556:89-703(+)|eukprot:CAMPEP_0183735576 /NCGR_PEP_ID=MMETSP0737-20130205/47113_1 /TAXON_ID=385413 /ORGANISM="Thalassiosira miniscula, Strain CCMP1093" /LENGTH=204 /DNA_ID=CAMNT_0025969373 /DNA_START=34 /DNA_END=648 /DNA_ORIENTATION=+